MRWIKHLFYGLLWIAYLLFSFYLYPLYSSDVAFPSIMLVALGAWLYGRQIGLCVSLVALPVHFYLFDYYAEYLVFYQGKLSGTIAYITVSYFAGLLRDLKVKAKNLSADLEKNVDAQTNDLNELIKRLVDDDERMRLKLGQDLHDGLGQYLTGLLLSSSALHEALDATDSTLASSAHSLIKDIERTLKLSRKVSRTLFPFSKTDKGLAAALDELISYLRETTNIEFETVIDESDCYIPERTLIHIYRIACESILNTIYLYTPRLIRIRFRSGVKYSSLEVKAEGCSHPNISHNSIDVALINYRAKLISGKYSIATESSGNICSKLTLTHSDLMLDT